MTVDSVLFIAIAEIAGVFVGFGALISVTRRSDVEPAQPWLDSSRLPHPFIHPPPLKG